LNPDARFNAKVPVSLSVIVHVVLVGFRGLSCRKIVGVNEPGVEVSMPHPRTAKSDVLFVILATVAFLISGLVMASPNPGTQQEHLISPPPQEGHLIPPRPCRQQCGTGMQVLSSTEGVDFRTYLDSLYFSIRRNFLAKIPESAAGGEKGIVVVRFQIQKDGTLPDKSATILSSSGKKDMDAAALSAIRTAAPFARLPEGYAATTLDLQFSFFYNSEPQLPAPEQKPKVVP
jgi:TonB family protein